MCMRYVIFGLSELNALYVRIFRSSITMQVQQPDSFRYEHMWGKFTVKAFILLINTYST